MDIWQQTLDVLNAPITEIDGKILTPLGVIQIVVILGLTLLALAPARRLLRRSLSERFNLDECSTVWIVRLTTWLVLLASVDFIAQPVPRHAPAAETDDAEQSE